MYMGLWPETKLYNEWKILIVYTGPQRCVCQLEASKSPGGYKTNTVIYLYMKFIYIVKLAGQLSRYSD